VADKVSQLTRLNISGKMRILASCNLDMSPCLASGRQDHYIRLTMKLSPSVHEIDTSGIFDHLEGI
jgi:hypothetical protein